MKTIVKMKKKVAKNKKEMEGEVTIKNINGHSMIKFSQFGKNGKVVDHSGYLLTPEEQGEIDKKVALRKKKKNKELIKIIADIEKLKKSSDKVELYELAITEAKKTLTMLEKYIKDVFDMVPLPVAEREKQMVDCLIWYEKFAISHYEWMLSRKGNPIKKRKTN